MGVDNTVATVPKHANATVPERLEANRKNWNERTPVHVASEFYDVESFRLGRCTLMDIERREVGDVDGKTILHLQCHFGMDTMSWARRGARATGVDFSDVAIDAARLLNAELGLGARFICSNLYDLPDVLDEKFDIVFTSYGVLCWLPDIAAWARVVRQFVRPGGMFYIVEGHPFMEPFDEVSDSGEATPAYGYFHEEFFWEGGEESYAGSQTIESPNYEWHHSIGEIVTALIDAGLTIQFLHEFPFSGWQVYPVMKQGKDGWWRFPEHNDSFPQLFSIKAAG